MSKHKRIKTKWNENTLLPSFFKEKTIEKYVVENEMQHQWSKCLKQEIRPTTLPTYTRSILPKIQSISRH